MLILPTPQNKGGAGDLLVQARKLCERGLVPRRHPCNELSYFTLTESTPHVIAELGWNAQSFRQEGAFGTVKYQHWKPTKKMLIPVELSKQPDFPGGSLIREGQTIHDN